MSSASAAQVGPPVLARNDVGVDDMILGQGQERTSWASPARDSCNFRGMLTSKGDRSLLGLVPAKNG